MSRELNYYARDTILGWFSRLEEALKNGDSATIEGCGLTPHEIYTIENMSISQQRKLAELYFRSQNPATFFNINTAALGVVLSQTTKIKQYEHLVDEYIRRGATKDMMRVLFGIRGDDLSRLKARLNVQSTTGRKSRVSETDKDLIFNTYLKVPDEDAVARLLTVSQITNMEIWKVYLVVEDVWGIDDLVKPKTKKSKGAVNV